MDNSGDKKSCGDCSGAIFWWTKLVVAVLAVPSLGIIVSSLVPVKGSGEVVVFVLSCWLCVYLGMHLMKNPKLNKK